MLKTSSRRIEKQEIFAGYNVRLFIRDKDFFRKTSEKY